MKLEQIFIAILVARGINASDSEESRAGNSRPSTPVAQISQSEVIHEHSGDRDSSIMLDEVLAEMQASNDQPDTGPGSYIYVRTQKGIVPVPYCGAYASADGSGIDVTQITQEDIARAQAAAAEKFGAENLPTYITDQNGETHLVTNTSCPRQLDLTKYDLSNLDLSFFGYPPELAKEAGIDQTPNGKPPITAEELLKLAYDKTDYLREAANQLVLLRRNNRNPMTTRQGESDLEDITDIDDLMSTLELEDRNISNELAYAKYNTLDPSLPEHQKKEEVIQFLSNMGHTVMDLCPNSSTLDYIICLQIVQMGLRLPVLVKPQVEGGAGNIIGDGAKVADDKAEDNHEKYDKAEDNHEKYDKAEDNHDEKREEDSAKSEETTSTEESEDKTEA